jgi:hypothetical protein
VAQGPGVSRTVAAIQEILAHSKGVMYTLREGRAMPTLRSRWEVAEKGVPSLASHTNSTSGHAWDALRA